MTSTIGVMQFVVQLAHEMTVDEVSSSHVHAVDDRLHLALLRRCRQQDCPRARLDVLFDVLASRERARALEHELDAELLPGQLQRVAASSAFAACAGDHEIAAVNDHGLLVAPVDRVEAEQIREVVDIHQVVDRDELEARLVEHQLQDRASDPAQTIDRDLGSHAAVTIGPGTPGTRPAPLIQAILLGRHERLLAA